MQFPRSIGPAHARRQVPIGTEGQEILYARKRFSLRPKEWLSPRRQRLLAGERMVAALRQNAKTSIAQIVGIRFAKGSFQQSAKESDPVVRRLLDPRSGVKTQPEWPGRALFAAAEDGPTDAVLIVQGQRQGQGQQQ